MLAHNHPIQCSAFSQLFDVYRRTSTGHYPVYGASPVTRRTRVDYYMSDRRLEYGYQGQSACLLMKISYGGSKYTPEVITSRLIPYCNQESAEKARTLNWRPITGRQYHRKLNHWRTKYLSPRKIAVNFTV